MSRMFTPEPSLSGAMDDFPGAKPRADEADFEFVIGRRQIASLGLVAVTVLAGVAGAAYIAGKAVAQTSAPAAVSNAPAASAATPVKAPEAPKPAPPPPAALPAGSGAVDPAILDAPLAGIPEPGKTYLQLGSVERGFATLMAEGARKIGFPAFLAPGATPSVYRVLSGPFASSEDLQRARTIYKAMGLDPFSKKYQEMPAATPEQPEPTQP